MSNNKMKGLLKGLRYISQIFDNEKEPEMQIGFPTDVKHVAHIGWDGPSVNNPSWMNEFKSSPGFSSAPLGAAGDIKHNNNGVKWVSEDSSRRGPKHMSSPARDLPDLPKSSRRQPSTESLTDSPKKEKTRQSRRSSRGSKDPNRPAKDLTEGCDSPARDLPGIPKKTRRKKSKDSVGGKLRVNKSNTSETNPFDTQSESGSVCNESLCEERISVS